MDALDNFSQTIHSYINTWQRRTFSTFFKKDRFSDLTIINFENASSHQYVVRKAKSSRMAKSEITWHSFLVLIQKWHSVLKNCSCKLLSFNNSTNSSWAVGMAGVSPLKFQLCMVCGSNLSWIEVQSASETVLYEAFNFSLKLRSVLWKQIA